MKIIEHSRPETIVSRSLVFELTNVPGAGYSFECDETGAVLPLKNDAARTNYELCLSGRDERGAEIVGRGVESHEHTYTVPAVGRCSCGATVELAEFTNACDRCGAEYNFAGQALRADECYAD